MNNDPALIETLINDVIDGNPTQLTDREIATFILERGVEDEMALKLKWLSNRKMDYPYTFSALFTSIARYDAHHDRLTFSPELTDKVSGQGTEDDRTAWRYFQSRSEKTSDLLLAYNSENFDKNSELANRIFLESKLISFREIPLVAELINHALSEDTDLSHNLVDFINHLYKDKAVIDIHIASSLVQYSYTKLFELNGNNDQYNTLYLPRFDRLIKDLYNQGSVAPSVMTTFFLTPNLEASQLYSLLKNLNADLNSVSTPNLVKLLQLSLSREHYLPLIKHALKDTLTRIKRHGFELNQYKNNLLAAINDDPKSIKNLIAIDNKLSHLYVHTLKGESLELLKSFGWEEYIHPAQLYRYCRLTNPKKFDIKHLPDYSLPQDLYEGFFDSKESLSASLQSITSHQFYNVSNKVTLNHIMAGLMDRKTNSFGELRIGDNYLSITNFQDNLVKLGIIDIGNRRQPKYTLRELLKSNLFENDKNSPVIYADNILLVAIQAECEFSLKTLIENGHSVDRPVSVSEAVASRKTLSAYTDRLRSKYVFQESQYSFCSLLSYLLFTNSHVESAAYSSRFSQSVDMIFHKSHGLLNTALSYYDFEKTPVNQEEVKHASLHPLTFHQLLGWTKNIPICEIPPLDETWLSPLYRLITNNELYGEDRGRVGNEAADHALSLLFEQTEDVDPVVAIIKVNDELRPQRLSELRLPEKLHAQIQNHILTRHTNNEIKPRRRGLKI